MGKRRPLAIVRVTLAMYPALTAGHHSHLPDAEQLRIEETRIAPIKPIKPRSPEQAQIDGLKARRDQATQALKAAQQRQRVSKAQRSLQSAINATNNEGFFEKLAEIFGLN